MAVVMAGMAGHLEIVIRRRMPSTAEEAEAADMAEMVATEAEVLIVIDTAVALVAEAADTEQMVVMVAAVKAEEAVADTLEDMGETEVHMAGMEADMVNRTLEEAAEPILTTKMENPASAYLPTIF